MSDAVGVRRALSWRVAIAASSIAAFLAFAWVAAHWVWRWVAPAPANLVSPVPADPAATILASGLWASASDAPSGAAVPASGEARLVGVLAERDGKGLAVFRTRDGARVAAAGEEIVPGMRLVSIDTWSVTVADAAGERTLELRREPAAVGPVAAPVRPGAAPRTVTTMQRAAPPACAVPAGFSGAVLKLHAELLDGLIAQPESWRAMFTADRGSLVVREDGGFATMLGLVRGDRVTQANGIALQQPDDVVGAVLRPLAANQPVRIAGSRNGQPREVLAVNASACP
jgi:hypothetical protein